MEKKIKHKCVKCGKERKVSRQVIWGIKTGKVSGMCRSCSRKGDGAGRRNSPNTEFKKGDVSWNKDTKHSKKHKENLKKAWGKKKEEGRGAPWNKGLDGWNNGHEPYYIAYGKDNPNWKGGVTVEKRNGNKYKDWRINVYKRDGFSCVVCGSVGKKLNAHHIKEWVKFPELRFDINNGVTMCEECHKLYHKEKRSKILLTVVGT